MSGPELIALSPLLILSTSTVVVMLSIAVSRSHRLVTGLCAAGLLAALAAVIVLGFRPPQQVATLFVMDGYAMFFMGLVCAGCLATIPLAHAYLEQRLVNREEFYLLLLLVAIGAAVIVSSGHFVSFFLGLELLSVSLYALVAYPRQDLPAIEAGIKYLVLASVSDAFLLFGIALIYAQAGTMEFARISVALEGKDGLLVPLGSALLLVGFGFKLSAVPLHMWAPDVYEGAPAPVGGILATVSKGAVFALILRYFTNVDVQEYPALVVCFSAAAIASMVVGNLLALLQNNVKRLLAYSSISHMGYLLVAFLAGGESASLAVGFYLVAYFVTTIGAFGVIVARSTEGREADTIDDYRGLAYSDPFLATVFTLMLLSLAGIPLTAGFLGKFLVVASGVNAALWPAVFTLIVMSVVGLYYYLRVILAMFTPGLPADDSDLLPPVRFHGVLAVLLILGVLLVGLGVYPAPMLRIIQATVGSFS